MEQIFAIMLPPLVACLILTGIHTYLGLHVVSRGVIFVDLALAQIAALGSTFAFLLGFQPQSLDSYGYSLGFTFVGAAIFSLSRLRDQRVPQEALIGITFAVASSTAILIADRAPQGAEHIEAMLTGAILWVSWSTILKTLAIYSVVGLFHFIFRRQFLMISMDPRKAADSGMAVRWWDFLFYMSFGFVITSSVAIAGVLLVFSFLIIPSVIGMLFSSRVSVRLAIGWAAGAVVSLVGLLASYRLDFPSGPAVVCSFGLCLIVAASFRYVRDSVRPIQATGRLAVGSALVGLLLFLAVGFRPQAHLGPDADTDQARIVAALSRLGAGEADAESLELVMQAREGLGRQVTAGELSIPREVVEALGQSGDARLVPLVLAVLESSEDPWLKYSAANVLTYLGEKEGIHQLIQLLGTDAPPFLRVQVKNRLIESTANNFGYDPMKSQIENEVAVDKFEVWWHENRERLEWNPESGRFLVR